MATASYVTVMTPNRRMVRLKTTPTTTLAELLGEACLKQGFVAAEHGLQRNGRPLDLSLSVRLANIPNHAVLEALPAQAAAAPASLRVGLQLPDGARPVGQFPLHTSLWDILHDRAPAEACVGDDGSQPALTYMARRVVGEAALRGETLASLGARANLLLRLSRPKLSPEETEELAKAAADTAAKKTRLQEEFQTKRLEMEAAKAKAAERDRLYQEQRDQQEEELQTLQGSEEAEEDTPDHNSPSHGPMEVDDDVTQRANLANFLQRSPQPRSTIDFRAQTHPEAEESPAPFLNFKFPEATAGQDLRKAERGSAGVAKEVCEALAERRALVYRVEEAGEGAVEESKTAEESEDFFQLTVSDVARLQRELRLQAAKAGTLMTRTGLEAMKRRNEARKLEAWRRSVVRVLLPDRHVLQLRALSAEPVDGLYAAVRDVLNPDLGLGPDDFRLAVPPRQRVEPGLKDQRVFDAGLSPAASLVFQAGKAKTGVPYLRPGLALTSARDAARDAREWLDANAALRLEDMAEKLDDAGADQDSAQPRPSPAGPAWLIKGLGIAKK